MLKLNRETPELALNNYIVMPPDSSVAERGNNILHINTKNRHYSNNDSATLFVNDVLLPANARMFDSDATTLKFGVEEALKQSTGIFLEFGFCTGTTINFIAALAYNSQIYGFDSLTGLPENWRPGFSANVFGYKDKTRWPFIPLANVELIIGDIAATLSPFKNEVLQCKDLAFIHIDTDTYEAATTIYGQLEHLIKPEETVIVLDEGYNFSDKTRNNGHNEWMMHEYKATIEFATRRNYKINFLAFNATHQQLVITFSNQ